MATSIAEAPSAATRHPSVESIVDSVRATLAATTAASESSRRLAPEAASALIEARIVRAFLPAKYNGLELGPVEGIRLFEELATIDSAASWVGMISAAGAWLCVVLPEEAGAEMLDDPRSFINGSLFPPMAAAVEPGGYRISGRTSFGSGCEHATWLGFQAIVMENGAPKIGPNGAPEMLIVHAPAKSARIVPHWDTLGMRGTGSHDFEVENLFVPERYVWRMGPYAPVNPAFTGGLSRIGVWWLSAAVASVSLGIARAAIADLEQLAQTKVPGYSHTGLADRPVVQDKLARARAGVDAARAYLYSSLAAADRFVATEPKLTIEAGLPIALAASHAVESATAAVDLVHACAGTTGIREEARFQRYFRDVHTISQHAFASAARFESVGKVMLGRESDWPFYYL